MTKWLAAAAICLGLVGCMASPKPGSEKIPITYNKDNVQGMEFLGSETRRIGDLADQAKRTTIYARNFTFTKGGDIAYVQTQTTGTYGGYLFVMIEAYRKRAEK